MPVSKMRYVAAPVVLRTVQREVRVADQHGRRVAVGRRDRDADARADLVDLPVDQERSRQHLDDALGERTDAGEVRDVAGEDRELVAADPCDERAVAHDRREASRDADQQRVADRMAVRVVDVLEAVEVERQQRERAAFRAPRRQHLLDRRVEARAIREAGQRIAVREPAHLGLGPQPLALVAHRDHDVRPVLEQDRSS